jgi:hypothetical protein
MYTRLIFPGKSAVLFHELKPGGDEQNLKKSALVEEYSTMPDELDHTHMERTFCPHAELIPLKLRKVNTTINKAFFIKTEIPC